MVPSGAGADGQLLNRHRKVMPTMAERIWWGQGNGDSLHAVQTEAGRVGALICWEHWMPLTRTALHATSEDIHVAAWPRVSVNAILSFSFCWALSKHSLRYAFCQATSLFTHGVLCMEGTRCLCFVVLRFLKRAQHKLSGALTAGISVGVQVTEMNLLASRHYAAEGRCFVIAVGALLHRRDLALADSSLLPENPDALLLDGGTTIIGTPSHDLNICPYLGNEGKSFSSMLYTCI